MFPYQLRPPIYGGRLSKSIQKRKRTSADTSSNDNNGNNNDNHSDDPYRNGGPIQSAIIQDFLQLQKEFNTNVNEYITSTNATTATNNNNTYNNNYHIECGIIFEKVFKQLFQLNYISLLHRSNTIINTFKYTNDKSIKNKMNKKSKTTCSKSKSKSKSTLTKTNDSNNNNNSDDDDDDDDNSDETTNNNTDDHEEDLEEKEEDDDDVDDVKCVADDNTEMKSKSKNKKNTTNSNTDNILTLCHLQPTNRLHVPSYTQLLYSACLYILQKQQQHELEKTIITPFHAFPIFCLYSLYKTNPLPEPPSSQSTTTTSCTSPTTKNCSTGSHNSNNKSMLKKNIDNTNDSNDHQADNSTIISLLPMGLVNRDNPKALCRRTGPYRTSIRIDSNHYIYLLQLREVAILTQGKCHSQYNHYQYQEQSQLHDDATTTKKKTTKPTCFCSVASDVLYIINKMIDKQQTMFEFCSYTGPCSLEGLAGHADYRKMYYQCKKQSKNKNVPSKSTYIPVPTTVPIEKTVKLFDTDNDVNDNLPDFNQQLENYMTHRTHIQTLVRTKDTTAAATTTTTVTTNAATCTTTTNEHIDKMNKESNIRQILLRLGSESYDCNTNFEPLNNDGIVHDGMISSRRNRGVWNKNATNHNVGTVGTAASTYDTLQVLKDMTLENKVHDTEWLLQSNKSRMVHQRQKEQQQVLRQQQQQRRNQNGNSNNRTTIDGRRRLRVSFGDTSVMNDSSSIINGEGRSVLLKADDSDSISAKTTTTPTADADKILDQSSVSIDDSDGTTYELRFPESISDKQAVCIESIVQNLFYRHPNMLNKHKSSDEQGLQNFIVTQDDDISLMGKSIRGVDNTHSVPASLKDNTVYNNCDDSTTVLDNVENKSAASCAASTVASVSNVGQNALAALLKRAVSNPKINNKEMGFKKNVLPMKGLKTGVGNFFLDSFDDLDEIVDRSVDENTEEKSKTKSGYMSDLSDDGSSGEDDDNNNDNSNDDIDNVSIAVSHVGQSALQNLLSMATKKRSRLSQKKGPQTKRKKSVIASNDDGYSVATSQVGQSALKSLLAMANRNDGASQSDMSSDESRSTGSNEDNETTGTSHNNDGGESVAFSQVGNMALTSLIALASTNDQLPAKKTLKKTATYNNDARTKAVPTKPRHPTTSTSKKISKNEFASKPLLDTTIVKRRQYQQIAHNKQQKKKNGSKPVAKPRLQTKASAIDSDSSVSNETILDMVRRKRSSITVKGKTSIVSKKRNIQKTNASKSTNLQQSLSIEHGSIDSTESDKDVDTATVKSDAKSIVSNQGKNALAFLISKATNRKKV